MSRSLSKNVSINDCLNNLVHVFELAFRSLFTVHTTATEEAYFYKRLDLLKKAIFEDGQKHPLTITDDKLEVYLVRVTADVVGELLKDFMDRYSFTSAAKRTMGFDGSESLEVIKGLFYTPIANKGIIREGSSITPQDLLLDQFSDFISRNTFKINIYRNLFSNLMIPTTSCQESQTSSLRANCNSSNTPRIAKQEFLN